MKLDEQYSVLLELKKQINSRLKNLNFAKTKELLLWLANSEEYRRLQKKDNQLLALDFFQEVWLEERKKTNDFAMQGDSFYGIDSLEDLEMKYAKALFAMFRIENEMPHEYCFDAVQELVEEQFSALALYRIIVRETERIEWNIICLSRLLKEQNQLVKAIGLLQKGIEGHPENEEMLLELADAWIFVQQWKDAYACLIQIKEPSMDVREIMKDLEKVVAHENV